MDFVGPERHWLFLFDQIMEFINKIIIMDQIIGIFCTFSHFVLALVMSIIWVSFMQLLRKAYLKATLPNSVSLFSILLSFWTLWTIIKFPSKCVFLVFTDSLLSKAIYNESFVKQALTIVWCCCVMYEPLPLLHHFLYAPLPSLYSSG